VANSVLTIDWWEFPLGRQRKFQKGVLTIFILFSIFLPSNHSPLATQAHWNITVVATSSPNNLLLGVGTYYSSLQGVTTPKEMISLEHKQRPLNTLFPFE